MTSGTKWLIGALFAAAVVVGGLVAARVYLVTPYTLPTASMEPTVHPGSLFIVYHRAYSRPADVRRGDIIAYRIEAQPGHTETYLKRVIGLPGDHVVTIGAAVTLNGKRIEQRLVKESGPTRIYEEQNEGARYNVQVVPVPHATKQSDVVVPERCFFVLGDNRLNSLDSRYTGCVPFADIIGRKL